MSVETEYKDWKTEFMDYLMPPIDDIIKSPELYYSKNAVIEGRIETLKDNGSMSYVIIKDSNGASIVGFINDINYPDAALLAEGDSVAVSGYYHKHPSVDDFHIRSIFNYSLQEKINGDKNG